MELTVLNLTAILASLKKKYPSPHFGMRIRSKKEI